MIFIYYIFNNFFIFNMKTYYSTLYFSPTKLKSLKMFYSKSYLWKW